MYQVYGHIGITHLLACKILSRDALLAHQSATAQHRTMHLWQGQPMLLGGDERRMSILHFVGLTFYYKAAAIAVHRGTTHINHLLDGAFGYGCRQMRYLGRVKVHPLLLALGRYIANQGIGLQKCRQIALGSGLELQKMHFDACCLQNRDFGSLCTAAFYGVSFLQKMQGQRKAQPTTTNDTDFHIHD